MSGGSWGGKRAGAGRKPGPDADAPHRARPPYDPRATVLVTLRAAPSAPALTGKRASTLVAAACEEASHERFVVRGLFVSTDQVFLVVAATSGDELRRGLWGLPVRMARKVNAGFRRKGPLWQRRYGETVLTPAQGKRVRTTLLAGRGARAVDLRAPPRLHEDR